MMLLPLESILALGQLPISQEKTNIINDITTIIINTIIATSKASK
jgi:hypothetical protein